MTPSLNVEDLPEGPVALRLTDEVSTAGWRTLRPEVDLARCTGCAACWKFCPDVAVHLSANRRPTIALEHCKGCGICAAVCPPHAIEMVKEEG